MLTGGAVITVLGPELTLHVAGAVLTAVPLVLVGRSLLRGRHARQLGGRNGATSRTRFAGFPVRSS